MVNSGGARDQAAPGSLESVRTLLNTWLIPNGSRQPTDEFGALAAASGWNRSQAAIVRRLRGDLRAAVESARPDALNGWIARLGVRPALEDGHLKFRHDGGPAGEVLVAVLDAVTAGTWPRLKACPDCRWVFYDGTRNSSKRWCLMYAGGPDGRACGTIAKVRRYRERQAAQHAS